MLKTIGQNVLFPLLGRAGTALAGYLVSNGANSDYAAQVAVGATALGLILWDLASSYAGRHWLNTKG